MASSLEKLWADARTAQAKGKLTTARKIFQQARKMAPGAPGLALELGVLEAQMDQMRQAQTTLQQAVKLDASSTDAHFNLAEVYRALGNVASAITSFQAVLGLQPDHPEAHYGLGVVLLSQGNAADALLHLEFAAKHLPTDAEAQTTLAQGLLTLDQANRALPLLLSIIQNHPDNIDAHLVFLSALNLHARPSQVARQVRLMEASFDMNKVIASHDNEAPSSVRTLEMLANSYQAAAMPERAKQVGKLLYARKSSRSSGATLLGVLAVQAGDFDAAEKYLTQAIELDPTAANAMHQLTIINRLPLSAEPQLLAVLDDAGKYSTTSKVYAGLALYRLLSRNGRPRDGFSALARAKALRAKEYPYLPEMTEETSRANKQVFTPAFFEKRGREGFAGDGCIFIVGMMRSGTTLTEQILSAHSRVHAGGERDDMMTITESLRHDLKKVSDLPADWAATIGKRLHEKMFRDAGDAVFVTDKLPGNIDYAGLIRFLLPRAKFIYCHRTPQDCALSNFEQNFSNAVRVSFDLKALAHKYSLHEDIAHYWMETCRLDMHGLDYDALVHEPEPHIRKLLEFAGLEFEDACLYPNEVKREIRTASVFQVRQPISPKSVGRWKAYETELEPFTSELARYRAKLGL
jgi:tetratricopeptide (TPR) repeat protein